MGWVARAPPYDYDYDYDYDLDLDADADDVDDDDDDDGYHYQLPSTMVFVELLVGLLSLVGFFFLAGVSVAVTQPLSSSMVRLRANYLPRAVSLGLGDDNERSSSFFEAEPMKIGPVTSGVVGMARRVINIEGWKGLWRGSFPVAIQMIWLTLVGSLVIAPFVAAGSKWKQAAATGDVGLLALAVYLLIAVFVDLPMSIISHRTIVHPHALPWTQPLQNLREILSAGELRRPWKLYALPGMASVCAAHALFVVIGTPLAQRICFGTSGLDATPSGLPADNPSSAPSGRRYSAMGLAAFLVWNIVTLAIVIPLQCATIRLSTQRPREYQPPSAPNPASHQADVPLRSDEEENEQAPLGAWQAHASSRAAPTGGEQEEPVVVLRPCASSEIEADAGSGTVRPYTGLADCLQTMVVEEGLESIYRGWGVSVFFQTASLASSIMGA